MNADERNLLAALNAAVDDDGEGRGAHRRARGRPDDGRNLGMLPGDRSCRSLLTDLHHGLLKLPPLYSRREALKAMTPQ